MATAVEPRVTLEYLDFLRMITYAVARMELVNIHYYGRYRVAEYSNGHLSWQIDYFDDEPQVVRPDRKTAVYPDGRELYQETL